MGTPPTAVEPGALAEAPQGGPRTSRPLRICLFGAAGDTGNLGVSTLLYSALGGIAKWAPDARVTVFDNGWGERAAEMPLGDGSFSYELCGARLSRRYHRPESFLNMRVAGWFGGLRNPGARALLAADAVWDVSGGDSFCDLYGGRHLRAILAPKRLTLAHGVPLVLLPQTYGPFTSPASRRAAKEIVRRATLAWARDERSYAALEGLAGSDFDPERHRCGVDMGFALPPRTPAPDSLGSAGEWLRERAGVPLVGLNVSGLIYNDPDAPARYGLRADYRGVMLRFLRQVLARTDARVLLVPHVLVALEKVESDSRAAERLLAELTPEERERVRAVPGGLDERETKGLVSELDWFCGTRMHSTIGALSSGVPTAGIAYSIKMQGVFDTCGQGERVADLRTSTEDEMVSGLWRSWQERAQSRTVLAERLPEIQRRLDEQMLVTLGVTARARTSA